MLPIHFVDAKVFVKETHLRHIKKNRLSTVLHNSNTKTDVVNRMVMFVFEWISIFSFWITREESLSTLMLEGPLSQCSMQNLLTGIGISKELHEIVKSDTDLLILTFLVHKMLFL